MKLPFQEKSPQNFDFRRIKHSSKLSHIVSWVFSLQIKAAAAPTESWGPRLIEHRVGRYAEVDYISPCTDLEIQQIKY